ncbi:thiamine phosphate synthase [Mesorhizobium sp. L-2-11]|uniref:thiamine phosphate synthase n=1 Tax=Mesorhizobium sp. L-2-11 TaxID=2744521 RepID=UPI00193773B1|nr:thiamine phosphate synthase [Mesorhizobium sp. L-2-11]BCH19824.1 hypothetical protein MesoLjLa_66750 [Mesorhizobium sp. L-2-11]
MKLDPFYLIVDSAAWIERLAPLGVRLVQLRIKTMDEAGLRAEIRKAKALCAEHQCQLIVNDHWRLAIEEGCTFVHLGQYLQTADRARIRAAGVRLGLSTHDHVELETAMFAEPDYIALGPIYPTILKTMKWAPQGLERIGEWKRRVARSHWLRLVALTLRLDAVFEAGADSAAVVGHRHHGECRSRSAHTRMDRKDGAMALRREPHVLVVGGSDSSGGAGTARDIETLSSIGVCTCLAVTALTVQTHDAVMEIHHSQSRLMANQMSGAAGQRGDGHQDRQAGDCRNHRSRCGGAV